MSAWRASFWTFYYLAWLLMFLAPELYWVFENSKNTLSWQVWGLERLNFSEPYFNHWTDVHWLMASVVWLLFLWLSVHLPFGLVR